MKSVIHYFCAIQIAILCLFSFNLSAAAQQQQQQQVQVQQVTEPGDLTLGAGLSYGSKVGHLENGEIGITFHVLYMITESIRGGADYTYYFIGENNLGASEMNLNGHYFIRNRDNLMIYGLGGLNLSKISANSDVWGNVSSNNIGINAGIGLEYDIGNFSLFAEPKFTLGGWNQFQTTAGLRLRI